MFIRLVKYLAFALFCYSFWYCQHPQESGQSHSNTATGEYFYAFANYDSAYRYLDESIDFFKKNNQWDSVFRQVKIYPRTLVRVQKPEIALAFLNSCDSVRKIMNPGDSLLRWTFFIERLNLFLDIGELDKAQALIDTLDKVSFPENSLLNAEKWEVKSSYYGYNLMDGESIECLSKALSIRSNIGDTLSREYIATTIYHAFFLSRKYEDEKALDQLERAEVLVKRKYGDRHPFLIRIDELRGAVYLKKYDFDNTEKVLLKAYSLARALNNKIFISSMLSSLTQLYSENEDYEKALKYNLELVKFGEDNKKIMTYALPNAYNQLGFNYMVFDDLENARNAYDKALALNIDLYDSVSPSVALSLYNIGVFYQNKANDSLALLYFKKSAGIREKLDQKNSKRYADCTSSIGISYMNLNKPDSALKYLVSSSEKYKELESETGLNYIWDEANICKVLNMKGAYLNALSKTNLNLSRLAKYRWKAANPLENPPESLLRLNQHLTLCLREKGKALFGLFKSTGAKSYLDAAISTLQLAADISEKQSKSLYSINYQLSEQSERSLLYGTLINFLYEKYTLTKDKKYLEKLFQTSEKNKAFLQRKLINENNAIKFSGVPDTLIAEEKKWTRIYNRLLEEKSSDSTLTIASNKIDSFRALYMKQYPQFSRLKYGENAITIKEVQSAIDSLTMVFEFSSADEHEYLFTISKNSISVQSLPSGDTLKRQIASLNDAIFKQDAGRFEVPAYALTKLLFDTASLSGITKIVWIPEGSVTKLSPDLLLKTPAPSGTPRFSNLDYLIKQYSFRVLHTADLLLAGNSAPAPSSTVNDIVGFAPFASAGGKRFCGQDTLDSTYCKLIKQPWAGKTIDFLDDNFSGIYKKNKRATKEAILKYMGTARIIHFGTHGLINENSPFSSKLAFSAIDNKDESSRYLYIYEVFNMQLNADLAVLTACQTGRGKILEGEGELSLAKAFNYAGCPDVLMTMWSVDDKTAAVVVENFYRNLSAGLPAAEALQKAKLSFIENSRGELVNPLYWSGFVLIGNDNPILLKSSFFPWTLPLSILFIISIFCLSIFIRTLLKKKKKQKI